MNETKEKRPNTALQTAIQTTINIVISTTIATLTAMIAFHFQFQAKNESMARNVTSAFVGELTALNTILENLDYENKINEAINYMESTGKAKIFSKHITKELYFKVYENNIDKIGLLEDPLPEKIALLYTTAFSILESFLYFNKIVETGAKFENDEIEGLIQSHKELLDKIKWGKKLLEDILPDIKQSK